jgi:hypothetical protein
MEKAKKIIRIGHDDFTFIYEYALSPACECSIIMPETLEVLINKTKMRLDNEKRNKTKLLLENLVNIKNTLTYGNMRKSEMKAEVFLKDLADMLEKYYRVQLGLVLNPASASGELETRTFEELMRDIVSELAYLKKEIAEANKGKNNEKKGAE